MKEEIWKDIPGYEGKYQASTLGRVKSLNYRRSGNEKLLNPGIDYIGYYRVNLYIDGKVKMWKIHQLIAMAFLNHTPCGNTTVVDHINNIKTDNQLENLQLITHRENSSKDTVSTSKHPGVSRVKHNRKWKSSIEIEGKTVYLGHFKSEKIAAAVYQYELEQYLNNIKP